MDTIGLRIINIYTSALLSLFFHWKSSQEVLLWVGGVSVLNILVFSMMMLSQRRIVRVHHILGKSYYQLLREMLLSQIKWQLVPFVLWEIGMILIFPTDMIRLLGLLCVIISLIILKWDILFCLLPSDNFL